LPWYGQDNYVFLPGGDNLEIKELIEENIEAIKEIRKTLNFNAELSFKEFNTQGIIIDFLKSLDMDIKVLAGTGVEAVLNKGEECIAVRADMDALPVNCVSHVCGHDYHMAVALGTALILKKFKFNKCVKFIFQPGEESEGGAFPMIEEGVLDNPRVTSIIGFHVWPNVKAGTIEVSPGPSMASVDDFNITFKGKGGHAAMPDLCKNPIYPAIDLIETMNIKSRIEYNPLNSHVITFSSVQCGNAPNVISDECRVLGTVRTFDNNLRNKIHDDILKNSVICAEKYGCAADTKYNFEFPPLLSDTQLTEEFIKVTKSLIGDQNVKPLEKTFAAEDFAFFAENVPSVHFRLGITEGGKGCYPLHSPNFNAADDSLFYGIFIIVNFILSIADKII
jgi:hippurate hydrolase